MDEGHTQMANKNHLQKLYPDITQKQENRKNRNSLNNKFKEL